VEAATAHHRDVVRRSHMRRRLQMRIVFEPARLSADHLRRAYELVVPIVRREVGTNAERASFHMERARGRIQGRGQGGRR
jgi:hypothetical protein